ncbi:MAG: hypothetical protein KatS3mg011_2292 [Acidimicrobiia bacterium]|nr:MAG: hypothetical protein KatS3mg011_2292 [Acidimicrobiia bacterium]
MGTAYRRQLSSMRDEYLRVALHRQPGFEAGLAWLESHLPDVPEPAVLCHGDYRFPNLTWTAPGVVGAVLDWERAWSGDPMADVAFSRLFSGWCAVAGDSVAAYEGAAERPVDESRVGFALRFERVRAYLSPLRLMRAIHEGKGAGSTLGGDRRGGGGRDVGAGGLGGGGSVRRLGPCRRRDRTGRRRSPTLTYPLISVPTPDPAVPIQTIPRRWRPLPPLGGSGRCSVPRWEWQ